jgi:ABC-type branched-subunit amino acid transport system substrate-binding protein
MGYFSFRALRERSAVTNGLVCELWIEEVTAKGGIYVKEYGKKLPIELIKYDDKSDVGAMTKLLEKTILEDKVDFILPPWGTAMLFAAAPIANKHQYILLGGPGGAVKLKEIIAKLPYFFSVLNTAETQAPALAAILGEAKVKKASILYIEDLHGIEYRDGILPEFKSRLQNPCIRSRFGSLRLQRSSGVVGWPSPPWEARRRGLSKWG